MQTWLAFEEEITRKSEDCKLNWDWGKNHSEESKGKALLY